MNTLKTISCSVTGYRKQLEGKPCEDATRVIRLKNAMVLSVADGHGDPRCLFAHIGSRLAVRAACDVLKKHYKRIGKEDLSVYWNARRTEIAQNIVKCFSCYAVEDYSARCPSSITSDEHNAILDFIDKVFLSEKESCTPDQIRIRYTQRKRIGDRLQSILYLYGTTLRASLITNRYMFHLAIGDGDTVILVDDRVEWVLPKAEAFECETASLCESAEDAVNDFLFSYTEIKAELAEKTKLSNLGVCPQMIALSTDGLRNSFYSDTSFANKMAEIYKNEKNGDDKHLRYIKNMFSKLTRESAFQDDVSAAFCVF
mgnify:FL=1